MNLSIKNRIAFISTILVALLSFTIFISIYQSLKISSFSEIDEKLEFEANKHFNELIFEKDSVYFAYPEELLEREHLEIEVYPIYIELVNTNGKLLVKSENLKNERIVNETFSTKKIIFNSQILEEPLRQIQLNLIKNNQHYVYQDGKTVFKFAVSNMADVSEQIMLKNNLTGDDVNWLVPHQANKRIVDATAKRMNLDADKVLMNIERYGNTTSATLPLLLSDFEQQLKKGDNVIFAAFGGGFTWGSIYLKWAYNSKNN